MKFIIMDLRQKKNNRQIIHVDGYSLLLLIQLIFLVPYSTAQSDRVPPPPPLDQQNFRPSMLVVILVLITAFFFMGFFSIYIRQCVGRGGADTIRPVNGGVGGGVGRSRRTKKGLDPSVIETFPTFLYSAVKALKLGKGTLECAVCLNEFEDDETLRLLPKCDHVFHPECIDAWLVSHTTCPVCRCNLNEITSPPNQEQDQNTLNQDQIQSEDSSDSDSDLNQTRLNQINNNNNESQEQVLIHITDDQIRDSSSSSSSTMKPEVINPSQIQNQNRRPVRSRSSIIPKIAGKFPRSHSTGHSLIQPGENVDRFTLRLPEDVRKQIIIENEKLNRTMRQSSISGGGGGDSNRPGFHSGSVGRFYQFGRLSKSDHWGFKLSMPFFTRSTSSRAPITTTDGTVKLPFDRLGSKADRARGEADQSSSSSSARPPV